MKKLLLGILFYSVIQSSTAQVYVNANATGANNGTSWADAYTDLHQATFNTTSGEIWVAAGTYTPSRTFTGNIPANNAQKTFRIQYNVQVYGGFNGTETLLSQRNWVANPTILNGDHGSGIKSYNVVRFDGNSNATILDGFTITNGQANGTTELNGGGIYLNNNSSPSIRNCKILSNTANQSGGGIYGSGGSPEILNCEFKNNGTSVYDGAAVYFNGSTNINIANCLFDDNYAFRHGGAILVINSTNIKIYNSTFVNNTCGAGSSGNAIQVSNTTSTSATVKNCIFYNNGPNIDNVTYNGSASLTIQNCLGTGLYGSTTANNITGNPEFTDFNAGDYTLTCESPAVNSGDVSGLIMPATDLNGDVRVFGPAVDMGAYENTVSNIGITANKTSICSGDYVILRGNCDPNGYTWSGGITDGVPFYPTSTQTYTCTGILTSTTETITIVVTNIQNENVTAPSTVCLGSSANVTLAGSSAGAQYYLRDNSNDVIVAGPVAGTGSSINFNTGNLYSNATYNVYGTVNSIEVPSTHSALDFDGSNDIVMTPYHFPQTSNLTMEAWIYPRSNTYGRIMTSFNGSSTNASTVSFDTYNAINNGTGLRCIIGNSTTASVANVLTLNAWNHVAAVLNNGNLKMYVNGNLVGSFAAPSVLTYHAVNTLTLGEDFPTGSASEFFNGKMDEVRVWNRSLTQTEIQDNMNKKLTGTEDSLQVYFTFDDTGDYTATDFSGNSNNGSLVNMAVNDWVSSEVDLGNVLSNTNIGHALDFDGTNDIVTTTFTMPATSVFSIEGWVYPRSTNYDRLFSNYSSPVNGSIIIDTYNASPNNGLAARFNVYGTGNVLFSIGAPNVLTLNAWNHIACTFNNGNMSVYVNGFEIANGSAPFTSITQIANNLCFGEDFVPGTAEYLNGKLDEIRVWGKALNQTEIMANMNNCLTGTETDLWAYYNFEDAAGVSVSDHTPNQNHGLMQQMDPATDWVTGQFACSPDCSLEMAQTVSITINSVDASTSTTFNTISSNQNGATYQWLDCNNAYAVVSGQTSQSFVPSVNGNYAVAVTFNSCTDTSACVTFNGVSLNELSAADFKVYPNPTKGEINILSQYKIESIEISNLLGQIQVKNEGSNANISEFESGVYYIRIVTEKGSLIKKLIKE